MARVVLRLALIASVLCTSIGAVDDADRKAIPAVESKHRAQRHSKLADRHVGMKANDMMNVTQTSAISDGTVVDRVQAVSSSYDDRILGFICVLVACVGFGSNFIPVKLVDTRDGQFFGVWMAVGISLVGLIQWQASGFYKFEPFAMLGGAIWAVGNLFVPFIVKRCGLGVGQLVWGSTNMLTGWATGTFGLFGKNIDTVADPSMNYCGVALAICALGIFTLMTPEEDASVKGKGKADIERPLAQAGSNNTQGKEFAIGLCVAVVVGMFFGSNFDPPTYLQQQGEAALLLHKQPEHSPNSMDYVLSHFAGILLFTLCAFGIYRTTVGKARCYVGSDVVLPGLAAGMAWGVAQVGWFKANSALSYVVAFPIIVGVPGVIAAIWGVVLFGENCGYRNLALLGMVIFVQAISVLLIALSKDGI